MWYYGLTTLSTIGFGDFLPKSIIEKLIISMVMLIGVLVFSFIMTKFIDLLMERNSYEFNGEHKELSKWIALLTKYNNSSPLPRQLILRIESFFEFYWA